MAFHSSAFRVAMLNARLKQLDVKKGLNLLQTSGTTIVNLPFRKHSSTVAASEPQDAYQVQVSTACTSTPFTLMLKRRGLKQQTTRQEGLGDQGGGNESSSTQRGSSLS